MTNEKLERFREIFASASYPVFFGGAGISTESGIPDFRGEGGIYTSGKTPEYLLSRTCLLREPELFFENYRRNMIFPDAKPNRAHEVLARLEKAGRLKAVVTQNIDGLHQKAGSEAVYELHGTTSRNRCDRCGMYFDADYIMTDGVPVCDSCGAVVRPDIVLYEEGLDSDVWNGAEYHINKADLLIVGGTSLVVNPAAALVGYYGGEHLVIINYTPTPYDKYAELVINESVSTVLASLI